MSKKKNIFNYLVTFLVSGLWHGANLTFVLWGGVHGVAQICEKEFRVPKCDKWSIKRLIRILMVFGFVTLAWVFFRAASVSDAIYVFEYMFCGFTNPRSYVIDAFHMLGIDRSKAAQILLIYILPLLAYDFISLKMDIVGWLGSQGKVLQYGFVVLLTLVIIFCGYAGQSSFVYFQF